jgi:hypothetical protein
MAKICTKHCTIDNASFVRGGEYEVSFHPRTPGAFLLTDDRGITVAVAQSILNRYFI